MADQEQHPSTPPPPAAPDDEQQAGEGTQALIGTLSHGFTLLRAMILLMLVIFIFSGVFIVDQNEQAFIFRFGAIAGEGEDRIVESGSWHWAWPKPVDRVIRLPVKQSRTVTSDHFWYAEQDKNVLAEDSGPDMPEPGQGLRPRTDGYLLSADTNILHTTWSLTYRITDPIRFYTTYESTEEAIAAAMDNAVLKEVARTPINDALYKTEELRMAVEARLRRVLTPMDLGITLERLNYDRKTPPRNTINAFSRVLESEMERSQKINAAEGYYKQTTQKAQGEKARILAEASSYETRIVSGVQADADYIRQIKDEYAKSGEAVLLTLYVDTLLDVIEQVDEKYILNPTDEVRVNITPQRKSPNTPKHERH